MAEINELFNRFPDYDNFTGKTKPSPIKNTLQTQPRPANDYGDGFGKADKPVKVDNNTGNNFLSVVFFPLLILWCELFLRFACGEGFYIKSFLYTLGFTLPIAVLLTIICTFFSSGLNRVLCNIFALLITLFYILEICYYRNCGSFLSFSFKVFLPAEQIVNAIVDKSFYCAAVIIPFVINLLFGHKIFGFRKYKIPAKLTLIIIAIIAQVAVLSVINHAEDFDPSSASLYTDKASAISVQERFGLLTMERLSIFK